MCLLLPSGLETVLNVSQKVTEPEYLGRLQGLKLKFLWLFVVFVSGSSQAVSGSHFANDSQQLHLGGTLGVGQVEKTNSGTTSPAAN